MLNIDGVHARWNLRKCIQFVAAACHCLYADAIELMSDLWGLDIPSVNYSIQKKMMNLKIKHIKVGINSKGTDTIWLELDVDVSSTFPIMGYAPYAKIETEAGYGIQWVRDTFGIEPEIINMKAKAYVKK